jgi:nucleoside-diphosphate-sugar epimerase
MPDTKKILIIGGSYFAGRVFNMLASARDDREMFVVNRGKYALNKPHVTEFVCDRHDTQRLAELLPPIEFDALIDFCAYQPGEIAQLTEALGARIGQYIYISTSSIYEPSSGLKTEDSPLATALGDDPISLYVAQKLQLEAECLAACASIAVPYTIFRPSFIYGPYNYAPRESWFIEKIVHGQPVPIPTDATAQFSFLYVTDMARALLAAAANANAYNQTFNLAAPEAIDYPRYFAELQRCNGAPFATEPVSVQQVLAENIPLPFPLTDNDLTCGALAAGALDFSYTSFSEGMDKTFTAFKNVYAG